MSADAVALMIDDPGARDLDDALSVTALPDGGWRAVAYVAGVAAVVAPGSPTDHIARKRVMSQYRPAKVFPMLGDQVERAATLAVDADREVLAVSMLFGPDGQRLGAAGLERRTLAAGSCVRLPYAEVPAVAGDPGHRLHAAVRATHGLATVLRGRRAAAGALAFYDLNRGYASTEDGMITLIPLAQRTIGYVMVAELMIAASAAVADWCIDHDVPILFRNHRTSLLTPDGADVTTDIAASLHDAELFEQLRQRVNRSFGRAVYDAVPRGHHALRVPAYAHVMSPLRRYPDLVSQQMVWAKLSGDQAPYDSAQLAAIAEHVNGFVEKTKARREEYFSEQRRQDALRSISERDYAALDAGQWRQMFDLLTQRAPVDGIETEVLRRLDAQLLVANDVARMAAAGPAWTPVRQRVFPAVRERHPEFGPSAFSGRAQILGLDPTTATVHTQTDTSPRGGPRFAARVDFEGQTGGWQVATTKKGAAAQAMWELLDVLCGHRASVDTPFVWRHDEPDGPLTHSVPADVSGLPEAVTRFLAGLGPEQRARAVSNPVSWLTNTAVQLGVGALVLDYQQSGLAHAPVFVCTVTLAGVSHCATATSKLHSRVAAVSELLTAMLAAVPFDAEAAPPAAAVPAAPAEPRHARACVQEARALPAAARQHLAELTETQRANAAKNPGAWVTNFASAFGLGAPVYKYTTSGPSHAFVFTCTATVAGMSSTGSGSTKTQARVAAVAELLALVLDAPTQQGCDEHGMRSHHGTLEFNTVVPQ